MNYLLHCGNAVKSAENCLRKHTFHIQKSCLRLGTESNSVKVLNLVGQPQWCNNRAENKTAAQFGYDRRTVSELVRFYPDAMVRTARTPLSI